MNIGGKLCKVTAKTNYTLILKAEKSVEVNKIFYYYTFLLFTFFQPDV